MFKNYLKIAIRNLLRYKIYSFINILGLAIGIACAILILLWVKDELSYDRFHENAQQIHQIYLTINLERGPESTEKTSGLLAFDLKDEFPEIINSTRLGYLGENLLRYKEKAFVEKHGACIDPSFFEIFTFPLEKGDPLTALTNPHSIILTEDFAKKYFGNEEPVGEILILNNKSDFVVTAVMKNIPANSHRKFDFLIPFSYLGEMGKNIYRYNNTAFYTYVMLQKNIPYHQVSQKIFNTFTKASQESNIERHYYLVPLTQTHLKGESSVRSFLIYSFSILALLILIIACINFINLSTARLAHRTKEIGVRKVIGASKFQLFKQFLGETCIITFIASLVALLLAELFIPLLNRLAGKQLAIVYTDITFILRFIGIMLFTGLLAGSYPAFFLSSFHPVKILTITQQSGKEAARFRKILVGIQFTFTIIFIIYTTVAYLQSKYVKNADLGFNKNNIIYIPLKGQIRGKYESVKQRLLQQPDISSVTSSSHLPQLMLSGTLDWGTKDNKNLFAWWTNVDYDYIKTFDMKMAQGRFYSKEFSSDLYDAIVVNETAIKLLGWDSPIGKRFFYEGKYYTIIGVVENFDCFPMTFGKGGLILKLNPESNDFMFVKLKPQDPDRITQTVNYIKETCNEFSPYYPLEYKYLDEYVFQDIEQTQVGTIIDQVIFYFTLLGIFISCLGLLGLSSYVTEKRTKEIGIRKVLGATVVIILKLISKEFVKVIAIANLIALPISYFAMKAFLQIYAYRIHLNILIFIITGTSVLLLALLTVSFLTIKAALANPVKSLRYE